MADFFGVGGRKDNSRKTGSKADNILRRKAEALTRQAEYNALTTEEKIEKLNRGGFKATKQRAKLAQQGK